QRRKLPVALFEEMLPKKQAKATRRLCLLLRLAILLNRSRNPRQLPELRLQVKGKKLTLSFPEGWLDRHPLTRADLEMEERYLTAAGYTLRREVFAVADGRSDTDVAHAGKSLS
ncbi:MAG: hypothetical protein MI919_34310, partial [Holophagales bacterium]|nr:hypothetical protein [Holophagales bacterium]